MNPVAIPQAMFDLVCSESVVMTGHYVTATSSKVSSYFGRTPTKINSMEIILDRKSVV